MEIPVETTARDGEIQQVLTAVGARLVEIWQASGHGRIEISVRDGQVQVTSSVSTLVVGRKNGGG